MKKKKFLLLVMTMVMLPLSSIQVSATPSDVDLQVGYIDPNNGDDSQRSPILIPQIGIEDYTLFFYTPCDGCELRIVGTNNIVEYSTIIALGTTSLVLPSYLSGTYEIQIIQGNLCFWGVIVL